MASIINRKARYDYFLLEKFEAGIILSGMEVKSIKEGSTSLADSYVRIVEDEPILVNAYIAPYKLALDPSYEPRKERKLLMHRKEIDYLKGKLSTSSLTIVPVKVYNKHNLVKVEVALAKHKKKSDKREVLKKKVALRETEAELRETKLKAQKQLRN